MLPVNWFGPAKMQMATASDISMPIVLNAIFACSCEDPFCFIQPLFLSPLALYKHLSLFSFAFYLPLSSIYQLSSKIRLATAVQAAVPQSAPSLDLPSIPSPPTLPRPRDLQPSLPGAGPSPSPSQPPIAQKPQTPSGPDLVPELMQKPQTGQ